MPSGPYQQLCCEARSKKKKSLRVQLCPNLSVIRADGAGPSVIIRIDQSGGEESLHVAEVPPCTPGDRAPLTLSGLGPAQQAAKAEIVERKS